MDRKLTDSELVSICNQEASRAIHGLDDDTPEIAEALDYYFGRLPGLIGQELKDPKASRVVSMDVADGVEATVAEIMPSFMAEEIAFFEATSEEDEDSAKKESEIINYLFMEEYNGFVTLQMAIKDALLHRNGVVKVYWDKRVEVSYEEFSNIPELALPSILEPTSEGQIIEVIERYVDGSEEVQNQMDIGGAAAIVSEEIETYSIKIKRITRTEKPVIEPIPPEEVLICGDHTSPFVHDIRFIAHEKIETQSSLIEQGFDPDVVKNLPTRSINMEQLSRSRRSEEFDYTSEHESTRLITVLECYIKIDQDGDGIAERRKVVISENNLLSNDEWGTVPLISCVSTVMPHKYQGVSMFDRLKDIQKSKTPLLRAIIDGAKLASNPRVGVVGGDVNIEDLLMSRTGGVVRLSSPAGVVPLPNPEVPQSVFQTMTFLDNMRRERGGSAIGTATQAQSISGDTAHGIERTMSAMEQNNALIARTIGETLVKGIFLEIHKLLRANFTGGLSAKIGGKWVTTEPRNWIERSKITVKIGSSQGERQRQAGVMRTVIDMHRELHAQGAPIVDLKRSYIAITDAVRMAGINGPEKYFIDPASDEGSAKLQQQAQAGQKAKQEQEQAKLAMLQVQQGIAQAEQIKAKAAQDGAYLRAENDRLKAELSGIKNNAETVLKSQEIANKFAVDLTKMEIEAGKDLDSAIQSNRQV